MNEYISECKQLYDATRYGWGVTCQELAVYGWTEGVPVADIVARMNTAYVCRRADRNV